MPKGLTKGFVCTEMDGPKLLGFERGRELRLIRCSERKVDPTIGKTTRKTITSTIRKQIVGRIFNIDYTKL